METPSAATTETTSATPDGNAANSQGAGSAPAASDAGEKGRIDELTGNWRETQRDRDYWRGEAERLRAEQAGQRNGHAANNEQAGSDADEDGEVKTLADFKYDEKAYGRYLEDRADKRAERRVEKLRSELKGEKTEAERNAQVGDFQEKVRGWATSNKLDAEQMFAAPADGGPSVSPTMAEAIMSSEQGPEILHYLTKNKAESRRIIKLSPVQQAREIGRLESKFASGPTQKTGSEAPPPHETVKGASDTKVSKDPAQMSDDEWYASKQRSDRARRAANSKK